MTTFINLDFESKTSIQFLKKHIYYSIIWLLIISILVFRFDVYLSIKILYSESTIITSLLPFSLFVFIVIFSIKQKWYSIAFLLCPILMVCWFIPKSILQYGKIYLFASYINWIYAKFKKPKLFIITFSSTIVSIILLLLVSNKWSRMFFVLCISYLYMRYTFSFISRSLKTPKLFGVDIEESIKILSDNKIYTESFIVTSYINQKDDDKLDTLTKRKKQIKRMVISNYAINLFTEKLNSFKGKRAYLVSWLSNSASYLLFSLIFFWILNYQLFKISDSHFIYNGSTEIFDFLYYTLKTITFGGIEIITPVTILARVLEIISFFTIGIFILGLLTSVFLSANQERVNENVKLAVSFIDKESNKTIEFIENEYKINMNEALNEVENINYSLNKIREIIHQIF